MKMTIITNRQTILLVLCLLAVAFVYLSISNAKTSTVQDSQWEQEVVSEVAGDLNAQDLQNSIIDQNMINEEIDGDEFFMEYRLQRDRRRAQEIELLQSMINSTDAASEVKQEVQYKLLEITNSVNQELTLETLIMAKGYADVVAVVQPEHVTVVVRDADFSDEDAARIADLVTRSTGLPLSKVTIFAKK